MYIVKLMGGLGNQMFQYALGRALSLRYNRPLKIDQSFLKRRDLGSNFVYRNYDLDIFNLSEGVEKDFRVNRDEVVEIKELFFHYSEDLVINTVGRDLYRSNLLFEGYWQSYLYFANYEKQLREDFQFKNSIFNSTDSKVKSLICNISSNNSVMLNVRRTDYLNTDFHGVMGLDYFDKAMKLIEDRVANTTYFIFSDDIDWCRENFKQKNIVIVDHAYKGDKFSNYLELMSICKHYIIPNSTFAWWSAWLNQDSKKIVIAPKTWFADSAIDTTDLIPTNWIRI
jgi:Glycosyl transferase family 11